MSEDELILTHILQCSRSELYLHKPQLTQAQQKQFESYKLRRQKGEPLQYILGTCDFMGLELKVDSRVLVPRPETEILVDEAIKKLNVGTEHCSVPTILDLGTGSGNIAIALAKFLPEAMVTTVDISQDALDLAQENAKKHGVEKRIKFIQGDMTSVILSVAKDLKVPLDSFPHTGDFQRSSASPQNDGNLFDLIISNPPYIPIAQMSQLPVDVQQEPRLALEAGDDGLSFYRDIIKHTERLLRAGAYLMMEFGDEQGKAIQKLAEDQFKDIQIIKDLAGRDRIIILRK